MAADSPEDRLVPFRWPSSWTNPRLVELIEGGPINCLLLDSSQSARSTPSPIAAAAHKAGLSTREWKTLGAATLSDIQWDSPSPIVTITDLVWPHLKVTPRRARDDFEAGPTSAPWIDSNCWVARLASVRAPAKRIWLDYQPPADEEPPDATAYNLAIADAAASGARWIVSLHDGLSQALAQENSDSLQTWESMLNMLSFFEKHGDWGDYEPSGALGVLSSFSGANEFMGREVLNLAARRNLMYRILDTSVVMKQSLTGLKGILHVDNDSPSAELTAKLAAFARGGGLLILPRALASTFTGERQIPCPVPGYELRSFGSGSLAIATRDWDDPYFLAADAHSLVRRRNDPALLFNARSLWEHYSVAPGGRGALLQLVGFTGRPSTSVTVAAAQASRSATMYAPDSDDPTVLQPVQVEGRTEYHLPPFSIYAALEFGS